MFLFFLWAFTPFVTISSIEIDPLGYILYCPCMGRFGNQADHFLGALGFAHGLNRTLVLPPWVEYRYGQPKSIQIPFDKYFKVETLKKYHKVITMEKFMLEIAPIEWPVSRRISFCYMTRGTGGCNAKEGNPFGPFWDTFNIDFIDSEFYNPLHYDTYHHNMAQEWHRKYPPATWPVLAFTGAPASFPVQKENVPLQEFLEWSDEINDKANNFVKNHLGKGSFIAIHLRNGVDWVKACQHIPDTPNLFSAPQCLGYVNEKGVATTEMCLPTKQTIVKQIKRVIKKFTDNPITSIFVSSDNNHMIDDLKDSLKRTKIGVFKYSKNDPHMDLAIMGRSNFFIGNCISSFSAFVKRERDVKGFPSAFWAFPTEKGGGDKKTHFKDEL